MKHGAREAMVRDGQAKLRAARDLQRASLQTMMDSGNAPADTPFKLAVVENEIAQGDFNAMSPVSWSSPNSYAYAPWLTSGFLRAPNVFF